MQTKLTINSASFDKLIQDLTDGTGEIKDICVVKYNAMKRQLLIEHWDTVTVFNEEEK